MERAALLAVAEVVEQWAPGVAVVEFGGTVAVAVGQELDHVLVINCSSTETCHRAHGDA